MGANKVLFDHYAVFKKSFIQKPSLYYLSFKMLMANIYWFRLLTTDVSALDAPILYTIGDTITDLDKHCAVVYRYSALLLGVYKKRSDLAIALLQKSLRSPIASADKRIHVYLRYFLRHKP